MFKNRLAGRFAAAALCLVLTAAAAAPAYAEGNASAASSNGTSICTECLSFDASQFMLPSDARTLIVVEGFAQNGGREVYREGYVEDPSRWNKARVTVFVRDSEGEA